MLKKKKKNFIDQVITNTTDIENYKQQKAAPHTEHAVSVVRSSGILIEWEEHKLTKIVFPPPYKPELKKYNPKLPYRKLLNNIFIHEIL